MMPKEKGFPKRKFKFGDCLKYDVDPYEALFKLSKLPKCCTDPSAGESVIQQFLAGSHIFMTGATGFMGKVLLEKLIASAPNVEKIYLLCREKKGVTSEDRCKKLFEDIIFSRIKTTVPNFFEKIVLINGDISQPRMSVSDADYKLLTENVNIIFHGAATVRFDEKLGTAIRINLKGVQEVVQLAHKCKHLKSFVHISTTYTNAYKGMKEIDEKFYPPYMDYRKVLRLLDEQSDEYLEKMTQEIIRPFPNTYAFTKQAGEHLIKEEAFGLPVAIFRPAIVTMTYQEPIRSWADNIYGPLGIQAGGGLGVLHVLVLDTDAKANLVPVDYCANAMIATAWKAEQDFLVGQNRKIYNYVSTKRNPLTWGEFTSFVSIYGNRYKCYSAKAISYPFTIMVKTFWAYNFLKFFVHTIPAYFMDGLLYLSGKPTILRKVYKKIDQAMELYAIYTNESDWEFDDKNVESLWKQLTPLDQEIYPFDIENINWDHFLQTTFFGLRTHIVKDPFKTLPSGYTRHLWLYMINRLTIFLVLSFFAWMTWQIYQMIF